MGVAGGKGPLRRVAEDPRAADREDYLPKLLFDIVRFFMDTSDIGGRMSDGPYRSLPMSASWKRVAQCGETDAFEISDISAALIPALAADWRIDVQPPFLDQLITAVTQQESFLFQDGFVAQLEALRNIAGCGLGRRLLDLTLLALEGGERGIAALKLGAKDALYDQASRRARQMEEHYLTKGRQADCNRRSQEDRGRHHECPTR